MLVQTPVMNSSMEAAMEMKTDFLTLKVVRRSARIGSWWNPSGPG